MKQRNARHTVQKLTFSIASRYCSTHLLVFSASAFVSGCDSALGASGMMESYPAPTRKKKQQNQVRTKVW
jgi:hypothetical protein